MAFAQRVNIDRNQTYQSLGIRSQTSHFHKINMAIKYMSFIKCIIILHGNEGNPEIQRNSAPDCVYFATNDTRRQRELKR